MYIKFCHLYGEDKKDEAKENLPSKLSVDLEEEKGKHTGTEGNARLYRVGCLVLTLICLVLLLLVVILGVKLRTGSTVCPETWETTKADERGRTFSPTCSYEQCQVQYHNIHSKNLGCMQCAHGWQTFGRSCFYLSTFRLSWEESQRNCTARGGSLAVITSQSVQSFLTKEGNLKYWIGLRQEGDEWTWVNHNMLQQSYWAEGESPGDCGILNSNSPSERNWMKASCKAYTYFICHVQF